MTATALSIVHESEQQRQYPRYRIPIQVEIDAKPYPVRDWSLAGFAISDAAGITTVAPTLKIKFLFHFDSFSTYLELDADPVWFSENDHTAGYRFHKLEERQLNILRTVIDAYISGELVSMNELIHITRRDNFVAQKTTLTGY